jgi:glutamine synthetase
LDKTELLNAVEKQGIEFINLMYVDLFGRTRSMLLSGSKLKAHLDSALGTGFDGSSGGLGLVIESSDAFLRADTSTFTVLPWERKKTAALICDVHGPDGAPLKSCPRTILRKTVDHMKSELGKDVEAVLGPEMEWYYLRMVDGKPSVADEGGYMSPPSSDEAYEVKKDITSALQQIGIVPDKIHHEVPHSKAEINFQPGPALKIADSIVLYKAAVKAIARSHDLTATFMPKPYSGRAGTGMHVHLSLADSKTGANLFSDANSKNGLSECALHFIGGLLEHARALAAITTPSVNSFKRLVPVPRFEAPVYLSWGVYNRSALIRVPPSSHENARLEYRPVDASGNPYLAFACIIEAGLDGVRKENTPSAPIQENVYHMSIEEREKRGIGRLPSSLGEALDELEKDALFRKVIGDQVFEKYLAVKRDEWLEYCTVVTDWEMERYLDI